MRAENRSIGTSLGGHVDIQDSVRAWSARALLIALCVSCAALFLAPSARAAATCANEAIRAEQGPAALALPDCRAYELASPGSSPSLTKDSRIEFGGGKASPDGDALSYFSRYPAKGSLTSSETWLTRRTASGWTVKSLDPQFTPAPTLVALCQPGVAFSEDLSSYVLSGGGELYLLDPDDPEGECGTPEEELVPGEPRGYSNLYLRQGEGPFSLANPVPAGVSPGNATYQAASSDLSRIVFSEEAELTPESTPTSNLFLWADGVVRLIGVLPNGDPVAAKLSAGTKDWGTEGGVVQGLAPVSHAVSADGERVFFEANGNLYLRENAGQAPAATANCQASEPGLACTRQIDLSKGAGASGGGVFQFASRDGDKVFFISDHALTFPASAQAGRPDLYEYDVSAKQLVNLTVASGETANVRGISGGSDDGSQIYFVARGALTGSQQNSQGEVAQAGQPNLYLAHEGALTYVTTFSLWENGEGSTTLGGKDWGNWWEYVRVRSSESGRLKTAWSPSGRYLLFSSFKSLVAGLDNSGCGGTCEALYLYDAGADELSCVSCVPGGGGPAGNTRLVERQEFQRFSPGPRYMPRAVHDSGQVFFETVNPLSSRDVNGFQDVYEYRSGSLSLISSGTAIGGSAFVDASADGGDVFFVTSEALVRSDTDGLPSIYDARVGGGFAEPPLPVPCVGEACRPPGPAPPSGAPPSTATFAGPGNVRPKACKRNQVRRGNRCVKKRAGKACGRRSAAKGKTKCGKRGKVQDARMQRQTGRKN